MSNCEWSSSLVALTAWPEADLAKVSEGSSAHVDLVSESRRPRRRFGVGRRRWFRSEERTFPNGGGRRSGVRFRTLTSRLPRHGPANYLELGSFALRTGRFILT